MHEWSDMNVHEESAMGLDSRAVSDQVTKQIVTTFSKTCNKGTYTSFGYKNLVKFHNCLFTLEHQSVIDRWMNKQMSVRVHVSAGAVVQASKNDKVTE